MKRVLITGAAGMVGTVTRRELEGRYDLALLDRTPILDAPAGTDVYTGTIQDAALVARAVEGVDTIVHLAGQPTEADWDTVRDANIDGCYVVVEAARRAGVRRIVFASTNHVIGFYRRSEGLDGTELPRPDTRYGVSKAFGEFLLRYYADKFDLSAVCVRIGTLRVPDEPGDVRHLSTWLSHRDWGQLVRRAIEADVKFEIVYGVSNNSRRWWHDHSAATIGYRPMDDAETFASRLPARDDVTAIAEAHQGGVFCTWP